MIVPFDTETFPFRRGRMSPGVVCVQIDGAIYLREEGLDRLEAHLHAGHVLVAHSLSYDVLVSCVSRPRLLPLWVEAYDQGRALCTMVRERLIQIAKGYDAPSSLLDSVKRYKLAHAFEDGDKASTGVRVSYGHLDGVPVQDWPEDARRYALADLVVGDLYNAQERYRGLGWFEDEARQSRADLWLRACSSWGMRTSRPDVEALARKVEREHEEARAILVEAGLVRPSGTRDQKAAKARVTEAYRSRSLPLPTTATGAPSLDLDACKGAGDPVLERYARYGSIKSLRARVDRVAGAGDLPIHPSYKVLKATGRTSCTAGRYGDQVQNPHREPGVRECYRARDGHVLVAVDWAAAELHGLAQVCLDMGFDSGLARRLNSGLDVHLDFGCQMHSWSYEWAKQALAGEHGPEAKKAAKRARQGAKAANFGFPGGLGIDSFRSYALRSYGLELSQDEAETLRATWHRLDPAMRPYFAHISTMVEDSDARLVQHRSRRVRGGLRYTSAANSYFQGLVADMAKDAGWQLFKACYVGDMPARIWAFVHDEFVMECPAEYGHEVAERTVEIMEAAGRAWCPDVPPKAEPSIMRRWRKGAEAVRVDGRLIPWEDRPLDEDTRTAIDLAIASGADPIEVGWRYGCEI